MKKPLAKTIVCLSTLFLLAACSSSDDDDNSNASPATVDTRSLNCSRILGTYNWTETIAGGGTDEITVDIGSTCHFTIISDTVFKASGTLTDNSGSTYTGAGISEFFCGGIFDITMIIEEELIHFALQCR